MLSDKSRKIAALVLSIVYLKTKLCSLIELKV